jgi:predicted nucleic acid-binding Zn ribbon protein
MKRTDTQPIGKILQAFFADNPAMADKMAETRLMNYWNEMSPAVSRYTENVYIKNKTLYVKLSSAVLKNELMMHRTQLVSDLNEKAGRNVITAIVFY